MKNNNNNKKGKSNQHSLLGMDVFMLDPEWIYLTLSSRYFKLISGHQLKQTEEGIKSSSQCLCVGTHALL